MTRRPLPELTTGEILLAVAAGWLALIGILALIAAL